MSGSWRLAHSFGRVHAMNELQYRANFFLQIGVSISQVAGALVSVQLVFSRVDSLNGWSHDQLLTSSASTHCWAASAMRSSNRR